MAKVGDKGVTVENSHGNRATGTVVSTGGLLDNPIKPDSATVRTSDGQRFSGSIGRASRNSK